VAERGRIGEVAEGDLDPDPLRPEPSRVPDEAADGLPSRGQTTQKGGPDGSGGTGEQQHARTLSLECRLPLGWRTLNMAYVIAEPCIGQKDNSCVEVCPVDCIHPTPDEPDYDNVEQLYIDPEECIDCDACVEACPVDACFAEDQLPDEWSKFIQINAEYFSK
jgi:NAD-dependent dihydropyrimidine dehydrogenase PreA subunit